MPARAIVTRRAGAVPERPSQRSRPMPRKPQHRFLQVATAALVTAGVAVSLAIAASSPPSPKGGPSGSAESQSGEKSWRDLYDQGIDLAKAEQYADARKIFEQLELQQPKNPEVLNMLAFTQRKTGDIDEALENYGKALKIKPKFPQAREYLGEAYLQAALRRGAARRGALEGRQAEREVVSDFHPRRASMSTEKHKPEVMECLHAIFQAEMSGIIRYLHYSFMIMGYNRIPIQKWFRDNALENMQHAIEVGEKITSLGGHPPVVSAEVEESNHHSVDQLLTESLKHEERGLGLYKLLVGLAEDDVALEEMARQLVRTETEHLDEIKKMLRKAQ
jgi:bacterioferritin